MYYASLRSILNTKPSKHKGWATIQIINKKSGITVYGEFLVINITSYCTKVLKAINVQNKQIQKSWFSSKLQLSI